MKVPAPTRPISPAITESRAPQPIQQPKTHVTLQKKRVCTTNIVAGALFTTSMAGCAGLVFAFGATTVLTGYVAVLAAGSLTVGVNAIRKICDQ